jgi:signal transduction histidine kinase
MSKMKNDHEKEKEQKEALTAGIIHELRNPINSLIGCLELVKDYFDSPQNDFSPLKNKR